MRPTVVDLRLAGLVAVVTGQNTGRPKAHNGTHLEGNREGAGLLAHIVVSKYDDHLPLYRQAEIYAREGVNLETSTLSDWVGATTAALAPLTAALAAEVMALETLHGDDTPVPVLAPGSGKTKTGRLWAYVRDERPFGGARPPAAVFFYSPDRKGEHPRAHLEPFTGVLHAGRPESGIGEG
jgi:hypothetical protein